MIRDYPCGAPSKELATRVDPSTRCGTQQHQSMLWSGWRGKRSRRQRLERIRQYAAAGNMSWRIDRLFERTRARVSPGRIVLLSAVRGWLDAAGGAAGAAAGATAAGSFRGAASGAAAGAAVAMKKRLLEVFGKLGSKVLS